MLSIDLFSLIYLFRTLVYAASIKSTNSQND